MKSIQFIILCSLLTIFVGCSGKTVIKTDYVEGTVTYQGKPVADANVSFSPVSGGSPAYGRTDAQGKYKLQTMLGDADQGTTPGDYTVMVSKTENVPTGKKEKDPDGNEVDITTSKHLLPQVYASSSTSPLKATVASGKNTLDFELQDKAK